MLKTGSVYTDGGVFYKVISICNYSGNKFVVYQRSKPVKLSAEFTVYCMDDKYKPQMLRAEFFSEYFTEVKNG